MGLRLEHPADVACCVRAVLFCVAGMFRLPALFPLDGAPATLYPGVGGAAGFPHVGLSLPATQCRAFSCTGTKKQETFHPGHMHNPPLAAGAPSASFPAPESGTAAAATACSRRHALVHQGGPAPAAPGGCRPLRSVSACGFKTGIGSAWAPGTCPSESLSQSGRYTAAAAAAAMPGSTPATAAAATVLSACPALAAGVAAGMGSQAGLAAVVVAGVDPWVAVARQAAEALMPAAEVTAVAGAAGGQLARPAAAPGRVAVDTASRLGADERVLSFLCRAYCTSNLHFVFTALEA